AHWRAELAALMASGASASDAARQLAQQSGQSRRALYALVHQIVENESE
ncbi:MAG: rRNA (cytidine-2'-O-)-methyltransferase, partial [Cyanobacteriota bacterium]|nr:rRNA (cytidine-2'-O-)-methyltransferase [Cyanobacteriota bacterium]